VVDGKPGGSAPAGTEVAGGAEPDALLRESGGQVGDTGLISAGEGCRIVVRDTQKKLGDLFVHYGVVAHGEAKVGLACRPRSTTPAAAPIRAHHSATHLLHEALRRRLGDHVAQKGSLNAPDRLRFDVSHPAPMSDGDLPGSRRR
jgi:alanyl-tRNA synthetase